MSTTLGMPSTDAAKERIVSHARRHFLSHGFRGTTMDDIAASLGMSKKTLYQHFSAKTALIEAVLFAKASHIDADLSAILDRPSDHFHQKLQALLACMQSHLTEIQPAFARDLERHEPQLFSVIEERRHDLIRKHFGRLFREGRKAGMVRTDVPVDTIVEVLWGAVQALIRPARIADPGFDATNTYRAIVRIVLEGVLTSKGRD